MKVMYIVFVIKSFANKETELVYNERFSKKIPPHIQSVALRKLLVMDNASSISDLRSSPSNHMEKLSGDRAGQYSIKINSQWRICFTMQNEKDSYDVEIVDYH